MPAQITANAATHFGLDEAAYCFCWRLVPRLTGAPAQPEHGLPPGYGAPEGYTSLDISLEVDGLVYDSTVNVLPSSIPTNLGLEIDSVDATLIFPEAAQLQRERVEAHIYDGALAHLFALPWEAFLAGETSDGDIVPLLAGRLGRADVTDDDANFEILSWASLLNTGVGRTTGESCDCARFGCGRCTGEDGQGIDITQHGRTVTGTVVAAPDGLSAHGMRLWLDLDEVRASGWANWGVLRLTSGPLAGAEIPVKRWLSSGEITLRLPFPIVPEIGTSIELEEGCDRMLKTCIAKQPDPDNPTDEGNSLRFQGFDPPGQAKLVKKQDGSRPQSVVGG
jgi:uncharacterized phage protein (TIGR02218 family)